MRKLLIRWLTGLHVKANRSFYRQYHAQDWVPAYPSQENGTGGLYVRCIANTSFYHEVRCN